MGNHVIAETMFRHDPRTMLYAPLRTLIWEDHGGHAWFTADQPSTQFASLGIPEVQTVGKNSTANLPYYSRLSKSPCPRPSKSLPTVRAAQSPEKSPTPA